MKYFILLRANMKKQAGSFIGIAVLMFIVTASLLAVLTLWKNGNDYEKEQLERLGYGDLTCWLTGEADAERLNEQIKKVSGTQKVEEQEYIYAEKYFTNGQEPEGVLQIFAYGGSRYDYHIYEENFTGIKENPEPLSAGEVYVSPAFCSLFDTEIGDEILLEISGQQDMACYTIKGFFEDPVAGSATMGIKSVLMGMEDMQQLEERIEKAGKAAKALYGSVLHIFKSEDSLLSAGEFYSSLNDQTDLNSSILFSYPKSTIMGFMLILQNVFSGLLLVFVVVLLIIIMVVTGHSISSSIEQEYVNMGILKAVGFSESDLRKVQIMQYLLAVFAGMFTGIIFSGILIRLINRLTVTTTGILIPSEIALGAGGAALGAVLLLLLGFICVKTAKIGRIKPIRAIRGGADDIYFKSRLTTRIHKKGLSFHLAFRQLIAGKRQYLSVCMVAALLVFFLSLTGRIGVWIGEDGAGLMDVFSGTRYDFGFRCGEEELQETIEKVVAAKVKIADQYEFKMERAAVNQINYLMNVVSKPEYFNMIEGRTCRYKNEIVVTEAVAKVLDVKIGDQVFVSYMGKDREFLISGIYQCANDMGENFGISKEGWEQFEPGEISFYQYYILEDPSKVKEITGFLNDTYAEQASVDEKSWSGLEGVLNTMKALEGLMYVITIVFIFVAVVLTGSKILYKEQHDMGIYKSMGFTEGKLRLAFSIRFVIAALAGSVFGNGLSALVTDKMAGAVLKMCGISTFKSSLSFSYMAFSCLLISGLFFAFSYLESGKVKKVGPEILIVE